ncbi:MAG: TonB-dependent receptor domain-containing protein [Bryobacteraceae bacterium]
MSKVVKSGFTLAVLLVGLVCSCLAQDRGSIAGTVTDASGAVIPAAKIRIVQEGTNASWSLQSNEVGWYYAPNMPLGNYRVIVQKEGFATATSGTVEIRSQANVRVDIKLQVGTIAESVEVSAQAELLDTATATRTASLGAKQIDELPFISFGEHANITSYLQYLPGAESTPAITGSPSGSNTSPIMNGSQAMATEVFVDGAPASDGVFQGSIWENGSTPNHYAEFNIVTNAFSAEYGRTGTWFYSVTTKGGTNDVHGSVYDNFVNTALNARDFFTATRQIYHQNGGGYTLGGPVYIPKVYDGRNKTFFFFGQDLFYSKGAMTGTLMTIPTMAMRQGDFSGYRDGAGNVIPVFDPSSTDASRVRTQFPGNQIPLSRFSAVSKNVLALMPPPDLPGVNNNWRSRTGANPLFNNFTETTRVDHSLSDRQKFYISYADQYRPRKIAGIGWGAESPLEGLQYQPLHSRTARLNVDSTFRTTLINHVTFGYDYYLNPAVDYTAGQGWNTKLGLRNLPYDTGSFPSISFSGGTNAPTRIGGGQYSYLGTSRWTFNDSLTWIKGSHFLKFGGSYWFNIRNDRAKANGNGTWTFTNQITSQPTAAQYGSWGSSFASFLLGEVGTTSTKGGTYLAARVPYQALFVQDEWHVSNRLSLSLGLRWENNSPPYDKYDRWANFSPTTPNTRAGNILGALVFAGKGPGTINARTTIKPWRKGFAPRFGYVYQFTPRLVMRGSFGIYYAPPAFGGSTPGANALTLQWYQSAVTFSSPDGYTPYYQWDSPYPSYTPAVNDPTFLNGQSVAWYKDDWARMGPIVNWTVGFQYQLSSNMLLDVSYLGRHATSQQASALNSPNVLDPSYLALGTLLTQRADSAAAVAAGIRLPWAGFGSFNLPTVGQALRPYPQYSGITHQDAQVGIARYNSLQIKLTKRYSHGLMIMSSFTWSKNLTNIPSGFFGGGNVQGPWERNKIISPSPTTLPADFKISLVYDLPFGAGKALLNKNNKLLNGFAGGWQVVFFMERASGSAMSISAANTLSSYGIAAKRASVNLGVPLTLQTDMGSFEPATDKYINRAAFYSPSTYELGNTATTLDWLRGWPLKAESASINKTFRIYERLSFKLGCDFQNPFNFVRWNNPVTNLTASNFGMVTGTAPGRRVQLNAEINF